MKNHVKKILRAIERGQDVEEAIWDQVRVYNGGAVVQANGLHFACDVIEELMNQKLRAGIPVDDES